jgi:LysM repeat protein
MRLSEFTVESKQLTREEWYNPTTWFDKSKPAPAASPNTAAMARPAGAVKPTQAQVDQANAVQTHVGAAAEKFGQGDNTGGVMSTLKAANSAANAAGASFLDKMEMGWMAIKAGASAAIAGRKGDTNAAINAAVGSMAGEIADLSASYVNQPDFAQNFQTAMLAMKDSTDPDQQEMYKKYMSRQLTAESFKAYMNRFNTAIQNMKKNPETAQFNTDDTPYVTPEELPTGPNANPMSQDPSQRAATTETAELNRILKLSGMEFIAEDSSKSITVQRGDTLGRIASDNGTTVDAILKINDISNPDRIYPGDVIKLPGGQGDPGGRAKRQGPPSAADTDSGPDHISREERALLNMIARRESSDNYNAINYKAQDALKKGKMQITGDTGHHPFEGQSGTTAAGRYQMLWNTWKTAAKWAGVDPENFSPGNQDRAALALAKWAYKNKYGGDLSKDIKDPKLLARVIDGLTPWSVKSGGPGFTTQHYASALSDVQAA